ncbi:hypothetical protein COV81_02100 [Candidatus Peregrinibacteria bacterium CG11_big_fil_rev_8_21_14_0_20_41_10]|nr:MAG: hypothetical protein COV81_02100 [Candidatus Peregrinibacteria bacterium CG11_big_fil_rev_8_21_14_0_20_41_10]PIZ76346.1 MAG: hypothetical protein COY06_02115 [Candidatus Peregrinibacteria bacterium CG_4_10_14_0_2_um_filter_41_8]PJC37625.1 MAG: hypothetical protein CO045_04540 [Candidatus Peregrinibacteria bacterium CG_4_9_14_0_2_um_filter_41_14]
MSVESDDKGLGSSVFVKQIMELVNDVVCQFFNDVEKDVVLREIEAHLAIVPSCGKTKEERSEFIYAFVKWWDVLFQKLLVIKLSDEEWLQLENRIESELKSPDLNNARLLDLCRCLPKHGNILEVLQNSDMKAKVLGGLIKNLKLDFADFSDLAMLKTVLFNIPNFVRFHVTNVTDQELEQIQQIFASMFPGEGTWKTAEI